MTSHRCAILVLALLLAGCGNDDVVSPTTGTVAPTTTQAPTTTVAPATTTTAQATTTTTWSPPADAGLAWARVPDDAGIWGGTGEQFVFALTAGGPGLAAAGGEYADDDEDAAVWVSADGYTWARILDDATFGGDGGQGMESVVAGGPGLVAAGYDYSGEDGDAAVWVSADGYAWARIEGDSGLSASGEEWIEAVTVGGPGLVAVGIKDTEADQDGLVWVSADGYTWTRIEDPAVFGGASQQQIRSVTAGGPGLVAVGSTRLSTSDTDVVVWVSPDGYTWTRVEDPAVLGGEAAQWSYQVLAVESRLVIVGVDASGGDGDGGIWVSPDGYAWTRIADPAALGGAGDQWIEAVTVGGPGLVAAGWDGSGGDPDAAVWVSPPPG